MEDTQIKLGIDDLHNYKPREDYKLVTDIPAFCKEMLEKNPMVLAVDTETYYDPDFLYNHRGEPVIIRYIGSRSPKVPPQPQNRPFGVSIYDGENGYWIREPLDLTQLEPLLASDIPKIFHNANFDMHILSNLGVTLGGFIHDTMLMAQLTNEVREVNMPDGGKRISRRLKDLAFHFLGDGGHYYEDLVLIARKEIAAEQGVVTDTVSYRAVDERYPELMKDYATSDVEYTYKIYEIFVPEMQAQELSRPYKIDMEAIKSVVNIERNGIKINRPLAEGWQAEIKAKLKVITAYLFDVTGYEFNINSDAELITAMTARFEFEWEWFTEKGAQATDKGTLKLLVGKYSENAELLEFVKYLKWYRAANKLTDTFIKGVLYFQQHTGKVHPNFYITSNDQGRGSTKTGRLSSANPNF